MHAKQEQNYNFKLYFSIGIVFSLCLPVVTSSNGDNVLRGVVCIDMTLEEITDEFESLQRSDHSYIFIINTEGRTFLHPMLPIPRGDIYAETVLFEVDIQYLEPQAVAAGIIASMER